MGASVDAVREVHGPDMREGDAEGEAAVAKAGEEGGSSSAMEIS